jgi:hypothetical protein
VTLVVFSIIFYFSIIKYFIPTIFSRTLNTGQHFQFSNTDFGSHKNKDIFRTLRTIEIFDLGMKKKKCNVKTDLEN